MGPFALRAAGLQSQLAALGHRVEDAGDIVVKRPEEFQHGERRVKYLKEIAQTCREVAGAVQKALDDGFTPLILGGDHSVAIGAMSGVSSHARRQSKRIGYLWLDAHGDMNTPDTSPSGNVHGMPLAAVMGFGAPELAELMGFKPKVSPKNIALVGVRDLDPEEKRLMNELEIHVFTMRDIDERGIRDVMKEALSVTTRNTDGIAVSLDMDFVDPDEAPGVGTPVRGGATYREAHLVMEMIADSETMLSLEIVEINPAIDAQNATAMLGVELVLSGVGKTIR